MIRSTLSAVAIPSPVNRWSEKMMWPDCSPPGAQRDLQADVAHHRGHDRAAGELAFRLEMDGAHQEDGVSVDDAAVAIDKQRAIAVAVEGNPQPRAGGHDLARQPVEMRRPAV